MSKLREHWVETNNAVVNRRSQLEQCLSDSIIWESQWKDSEGWLGHMEMRLDQIGNHSNDPHGENTLKEQKVCFF